MVCLMVACGVLPGAGAGARRDPLDARRRSAARVRLPGEDDGGVPGGAGLRAGLPDRGPGRACAAGSRSCWPAGWRCSSSSGWWVAIVALWPAVSRPMIDGSPDNSILNLIFGYNGFGRLSGGGAGGGAGGNFSGATGPFRLFNDLMGGQASWLLPAAAIVLVGGLAWRWRAPRTDRLRAALLLWGSWLVVSGAVFSFGSGVIHTYYTVALAPAIAALVAIGACCPVAAARAGAGAGGHRPDGRRHGRLGGRAAAAHPVLGAVADPAGDRGRAGCDRPAWQRPPSYGGGWRRRRPLLPWSPAWPLRWPTRRRRSRPPHTGSVPVGGPDGRARRSAVWAAPAGRGGARWSRRARRSVAVARAALAAGGRRHGAAGDGGARRPGEQRADQGAQGRRIQLPLGRGDLRLAERRVARARLRR